MVAQANDRQNLLYIDDEGDKQGASNIQNSKSSKKSVPGSKKESGKHSEV